jgi:hypothetical protein
MVPPVQQGLGISKRFFTGANLIPMLRAAIRKYFKYKANAG